MRVNLAMAGIYHKPFIIRLIYKNLQEFLPNSFVSPTDKTPVCVAPATIVRRKITPGGASAHNPENSIDKLAIIIRYAAPTSFSPRQKWFKLLPDCVRDIMPVVSKFFHGDLAWK
jgi:hypothetical protein